MNAQRFGLAAALVKKRALVALFGERTIHALEPLASVIGEGGDRQHHPNTGKQRRPAPCGAQREACRDAQRTSSAGTSAVGASTAMTALIDEWRSIGAETAVCAPT